MSQNIHLTVRLLYILLYFIVYFGIFADFLAKSATVPKRQKTPKLRAFHVFSGFRLSVRPGGFEPPFEARFTRLPTGFIVFFIVWSGTLAPYCMFASLKAVRVRIPHIPSGFNPCFFWKSITAPIVRFPAIPSTISL